MVSSDDEFTTAGVTCDGTQNNPYLLEGINITYTNGVTVLFDKREHFTSMLIAQKSVSELRYRLESFSLDFENRHSKELENFDGNIDSFTKTTEIIRQIFS